MKKRIITGWLVTLGIILLASLSLFLLYISPWAHRRTERGLFSSQSGFEVDAEHNKVLGGIVQKTKDDAGFEYSINCLEISGEIVFRVYYAYDVSGATDEEKLENAKRIYESGGAAQVLEQKISEVGTYHFDLSDERDGCYISCIETIQSGTRAKGKEQNTIHLSNWAALMDRIGIK